MLYFPAMLRLFKTWLVLLLITALPLQAAAAGMGWPCADGSAARPRAAHAPAASPMGEACPHHGDAARASAATVEADPGAPMLDGAGHPACGSCAGFCTGACMPPTLASAPAALRGAENVTPSATVLFTGFSPDGPLRPPRHVPA